MRIFPEESYENIINEIGSYHYRIYEKGDSLPEGIYKNELLFDQYYVSCISTGSTASNYKFSLETLDDEKGIDKIYIPKESELIVVRLLRYCEHDGKPHYNADDQIIFQAIDGNIFRLSRNDAPDHYINLVKSASLQGIAEAYRLPCDKSGPADKYVENGAGMYIQIHQINDK